MPFDVIPNPTQDISGTSRLEVRQFFAAHTEWCTMDNLAEHPAKHENGWVSHPIWCLPTLIYIYFLNYMEQYNMIKKHDRKCFLRLARCLNRDTRGGGSSPGKHITFLTFSWLLRDFQIRILGHCNSYNTLYLLVGSAKQDTEKIYIFYMLRALHPL